jgi:benzoate membrane transport protein
VHEKGLNISTLRAISKNIANLPSAASWTGFFSGLLVVFVSLTGPIAILYQAVQAANLSVEITNSWLLAIFMGSGLFALLMSLRFGIPIIGSWASTTTALLITGLVDHPFSEVIGAYFVASIILMIIGYTGIFSKLMQTIPHAVIMAMLAGVLLTFGVKIFSSTQINPILGVSMLLVFFAAKAIKFRAPVVIAFVVGVVVVALQSKINIPEIKLSIAAPVWTNPTFPIGAFFTLTIPIVLLIMTSQNAPGIALLKAVGYTPPINTIVHFGGFLSLLGSGFGGSGVNLSSITASIAITEESDPNPETRYFAGVVAGLAYCVAGIFAGVFSTLFGSFPGELTAVLAGIALLPIITTSLVDAMEIKDYRDSAVVTFLVTISGVSALGVGSPFWGLIAGVIVHQLQRLSR